MTHKATLAVCTGIETDQKHGAVVPPSTSSSNYTFADFGESRQYDYARYVNPTRTNLANALAALEGGASAVVTSTGMGGRPSAHHRPAQSGGSADRSPRLLRRHLASVRVSGG